MKEIWTLFDDISVDGQYLVFRAIDGTRLHVPNNGSITRINKAGGPTVEKPWAKFFRYEEIDGKNIVNYVENRTVDIIPVGLRDDKVFLIRRQTKNGVDGGIALPGGHIDPPESELDAALRELSEEILDNADAKNCLVTIACLDELGWVPEKTAPGKPPAEHYSYTKVFLAMIKPDATVVAGDDAADGKWYALDAIPWDDFHFLHHVDILKHWLHNR
jgi:ADP-ribose pyrophosphatase YjhB (NUDIX family)